MSRVAQKCGENCRCVQELPALAMIRDEIAKQTDIFRKESILAISSHLQAEIKTELADLRRDVSNLQRSVDHCLLQQQKLAKEVAAIKINVENLNYENPTRTLFDVNRNDIPRIPSTSSTTIPSYEDITSESEYRYRKTANWVLQNSTAEPYTFDQRPYHRDVNVKIPVSLVAEDLSFRSAGSAFRQVKTRPLKVIIHKREPYNQTDDSSHPPCNSPPLKKSLLERGNPKGNIIKEEEISLVNLDSNYLVGEDSESKPSLPSTDRPALKKTEPEPEPQVVVKKRGRPKNPNKQGKKKSHSSRRLWEFLRDLLSSPDTCPSMIKWENMEEGMFRFVQSDTVAKIWGSRKGNKEMSYEKLSRAMRYYYKSEVLQPVYGRRLVYKFGPKATGWRVADPNFEIERARQRAMNS